jgi:hypothetical protein
MFGLEIILLENFSSQSQLSHFVTVNGQLQRALFGLRYFMWTVFLFNNFWFNILIKLLLCLMQNVTLVVVFSG